MKELCTESNTATARMATLSVLRETTIPAFLKPVPCEDTCRVWFQDLPQFKSNPTAKRGGGPVYYSVSAVEKYLRNRVKGVVL